MLTIATRPGERGVWLFIEAPERLEYAGEYLAIGVAGRKAAGLFEGTTTAGGTWMILDVSFPVVFAAITHFELRLLPPRTTGLSRTSAKSKALPGRALFESSYAAPFRTTLASYPADHDLPYPRVELYPTAQWYPTPYIEDLSKYPTSSPQKRKQELRPKNKNKLRTQSRTSASRSRSTIKKTKRIRRR